jgi:mxaJ protein
VFVYRGDASGRLDSLDDPRLRSLRIGVALVGNDLAATPPAMALAQRGIVGNVTGFPMFARHRSAQRMTDAVRDGAIDVAVLWGRRPAITRARGARVDGDADRRHGRRRRRRSTSRWACARDDAALRDEVDAALPALKPQIDAVLDSYAVARIAP